ncbi:unnamed protein product [Phytophthora fragariaefolia]|uniref:Unnamed protein product n=1 Tax=Phytophthora fragariaefolia TaxID=1490495 RepID=A0A9W6X452_9STRA|nr:unnamed protein product [Phytophthora fragariaefolia]
MRLNTDPRAIGGPVAPLHPPSDGWKSNFPFWIRLFIATVFIGLGLAQQVREVLIPGTLSSTGAFVVSTGTTIIYIAMCMVIAELWRFPIPFGYILLVGSYVTIFWAFTLSVIGPRIMLKSPVLLRQVKSLLLIVNAQGLVAIAYPFFTAIFYRLSGVEQAAFVFVMPLIRVGTKQIIAIAAEGLDEYVGPIAVFSVDVFNVFYVAICMQSAKSTVTTLLMIVSDSFHVIVSLRNIFHHNGSADKSDNLEVISSIQNYLRDLPELVRSVFIKGHFSKASSLRIRVFAPFPLPLSDESVAFINEVAKFKRDTNTNTISPVGMLRVASPKLATKRRVNKIRDATILPNLCQISPGGAAKPTVETFCSHETVASRNKSAASNLIAFLRFTSNSPTTVPSVALAQNANEETVCGALQVLFHSEYLLMTEYIECALPGLYSVYLAALYHLPVAPYYPQTASLTPN